MRRKVLIVVLLLLIGLSFNSICADEVYEEAEVKNIVIFHSYHSGLKWTDQLQEGIIHEIISENVEVFVEYMDSYRSAHEDQSDILFEYYKKRYENMAIDIVVVTDNYAYEFMREHYKELFDGIPLVFGGINDFSKTDMFTDKSTGIVEIDDQKKNIELILKLHPNTKKIIALGGGSKTALVETQKIVEVGTSMNVGVEFEAILSANIDSQLIQLEECDENTVIIIAGTINNVKGEFLSHSEYATIIIEQTRLPVYAMASVYIEDGGAIGGYVINPYEHGLLIGAYVQSLIDNKKIETLPIIEENKAIYLFDYNRLHQFNIGEDVLPQGSIIINRPSSGVKVEWLYYFIMTLLVLIIAMILAINIKKRQIAETKLSKHKDALNHMSYHDITTNLYNREFMVDYLQNHILEPEHDVTNLYHMSISNLKTINDTYGYEIGNKVLKHIAKILVKEFNGKAECIGIHHSEFLIVDAGLDSKSSAIKRADIIKTLVANMIRIDYMEIDIKVNIGISRAPDHTLEATQLLKKANIALFESLKSGPNNINFYEDTLYKDILKRITLEKQLKRAIKFNEFVLYYQPKIDMKTMTVCGCEALIRWRTSSGKLIYPNHFIPFSEENGFIEEIGKWVLNEVVRQVKEWSDMNHRIKVSFNVSGREFDDQYISNIAKTIKEMGVDPSLLEVEITETAALKDLEHSRQLVKTLHDIGLGVSLDDFGTGYSSITYIKQLKASKLKIDKSFIDNLDNYEQKVVVDSMVQLGKKLDYTINIEGVETEEQLQILKEFDIDEVQGWLFSKAIPSKEFLEFVINVNENRPFQ